MCDSGRMGHAPRDSSLPRFAMTGECRLCRRHGHLQKSHLLPRALYEMVRNPKSSNPNPVLVTKDVAVQTSKQLADYLLCSGYESRFNRMGEAWVLPFLERADKFVDSVLTGKPNLGEQHQMLREFVFLDTFREQFRQLLKGYHLPTRVCDEDPRWHEFLKNYAGIIEDGSLSCQAPEASGLRLVSKVVFTKGRPTTYDSYIPFHLSWEIVLLDGRTMSVEVSATAVAGREMIFHGTSER